MTMMRRSTSHFQEEQDDYDYDSYVTYRPLSHLPTPPPCWKDVTSDDYTPVDCEQLKPSLLGPATHLVNLIPVGASLTTPSVPLVQAMLTRALLPLETIALAVCILDSLDSKFALSWRLSCPLQPPATPPPSSPVTATATTTATPVKPLSSLSAQSKRHTIPAAANAPKDNVPLHIDSVNSALIVLAALAIAVKFIDDPALPSSFFVNHYGHGMWTADQLNASERAIMININYRIMPLYTEELLGEAMVDMQLAARPPLTPSPLVRREIKKAGTWTKGHAGSASMSVIGVGKSVSVSVGE